MLHIGTKKIEYYLMNNKDIDILVVALNERNIETNCFDSDKLKLKLLYYKLEHDLQILKTENFET